MRNKGVIHLKKCPAQCLAHRELKKQSVFMLLLQVLSVHFVLLREQGAERWRSQCGEGAGRAAAGRLWCRCRCAGWEGVLDVESRGGGAQGERRTGE